LRVGDDELAVSSGNEIGDDRGAAVRLNHRDSDPKGSGPAVKGIQPALRRADLESPIGAGERSDRPVARLAGVELPISAQPEASGGDEVALVVARHGSSIESQAGAGVAGEIGAVALLTGIDAPVTAPGAPGVQIGLGPESAVAASEECSRQGEG
jgi:hypothetical protein